MNSVLIPKVRGRSGQISDPPEWAGKWSWEIQVVIIAPPRPDSLLRTINSWALEPSRIFNTDAECKSDLEKEVVSLCAEINKQFGGTGKEGFLDMNDGMKHKTSIGGSDATP